MKPIFGPKYCDLKRRAHKIMNFPSASAKLVNKEKPGPECGQCGASAGSGGPVEGPADGGARLLQDDGQHAGFLSNMA